MRRTRLFCQLAVGFPGVQDFDGMGCESFCQSFRMWERGVESLRLRARDFKLNL